MNINFVFVNQDPPLLASKNKVSLFHGFWIQEFICKVEKVKI